MAKTQATSDGPIAGARMYAIWNCPKSADGEPSSLVMTGNYGDLYPVFLRLVGKNPLDTRAYVMQDAHSPAPMFAG